VLWLTGSAPKNPVLRARLIEAGVGFMDHLQTVRSRRSMALEFPYWATDTGLFGEKIRFDFDLDTYLRKLDECPRERCLFATAPDVFGDGEATLRLSLEVLPKICALGFPAAFVAQPGLPEMPWDEFDVLFMGGPNEFKTPDDSEGMGYFREAKRRNKWCHLGRVNSAKRYCWARERGYDSGDGTQLAFQPDNYTPGVIRFVTSHQQLTLEVS